MRRHPGDFDVDAFRTVEDLLILFYRGVNGASQDANRSCHIESVWHPGADRRLRRGTDFTGIDCVVRTRQEFGHYLLVTLERCGCVQRDGCTGRYVIGQKILKMARPS